MYISMGVPIIHFSPNGNPWDFLELVLWRPFWEGPLSAQLGGRWSGWSLWGGVGWGGGVENLHGQPGMIVHEYLGKFHHDLTSRTLGIMVSKGNYPQMVLFQVNYCNLPRYIYLTKYLVWCFGTWLFLWLSHHIGNGIIIPTDEVHHFSEGRYTTNQNIYLYISLNF